MTTVTNSSMPAAPMQYRSDGSVAWDNMWESFCVLAVEGGPPHRSAIDVVEADEGSDSYSDAYQRAVHEIIRGIDLAVQMEGMPASTGWIAVICPELGMADWLAEAINQENVKAKSNGEQLFVPVGEHFQLKGEIKSVITAVAKTGHYWRDHLPREVKQTVALQARLGQWGKKLRRLFGK